MFVGGIFSAAFSAVVESYLYKERKDYKDANPYPVALKPEEQKDILAFADRFAYHQYSLWNIPTTSDSYSRMYSHLYPGEEGSDKEAAAQAAAKAAFLDKDCQDTLISDKDGRDKILDFIECLKGKGLPLDKEPKFDVEYMRWLEIPANVYFEKIPFCQFVGKLPKNKPLSQPLSQLRSHIFAAVCGVFSAVLLAMGFCYAEDENDGEAHLDGEALPLAGGAPKPHGA